MESLNICIMALMDETQRSEDRNENRTIITEDRHESLTNIENCSRRTEHRTKATTETQKMEEEIVTKKKLRKKWLQYRRQWKGI